MFSLVALTTLITALAARGSAQNISATIPSSTSDCIEGFTSGADTAIFTLPYPYEVIVALIDSFAQPNHWAIPPNTTVITNGTDNTVGTAREYTLDGVQAIETLELYSNPKSGPFLEVYSAAKLTIPAFNLTIYSDYDSVMLTPECDGRASTFNFTIKMCATNITEATELQHLQHLKGSQALGAALGGLNFTSCAALPKSNSTTSSAISSSTATESTSLASASTSHAAPSSTATAATTTAAGTSATGSSSGSAASATSTGGAVMYGGMGAMIAGLGALAVAALA